MGGGVGLGGEGLCRGRRRDGEQEEPRKANQYERAGKSEKELTPRHDTDQWCRECCYNMGEKSIGQIGFGQMFV